MNKEKKIRCTYCDEKLPKTLVYCPKCKHIIHKTELPIRSLEIKEYRLQSQNDYFDALPLTDQIFCIKCGRRLKADDCFCENCGAQLADLQKKMAQDELQEEKEKKRDEKKRFWSYSKNGDSKKRRLIKGIFAVCIGFGICAVIYSCFGNDFLDISAMPFGKQDIPIDHVNVSSVKDSSSNHKYDGMYLCDNDLDTAWSEGKSNYGKGESIELSFGGTYTVKRILLYNGYMRNEKTLNNNSQIHEATLTFSDGSEQKIEFKQNTSLNKPVSIKLDEPVETSSVTITIDSVYKGKNKNTCVSEIRFRGDGETVKLPKVIHRFVGREELATVDLSDECGINADAYLMPTRTLMLQKGAVMTGDDVKFVQAAMIEMGYAEFDVDGKYSSDVKKAVKKFQEDYDITPTGVVDKAMAQRMKTALDDWRTEHATDEDRVISGDYRTILDPKFFITYKGHDKRFNFGYPRGFYDHVEISRDDDAEIANMWCEDSNSTAYFYSDKNWSDGQSVEDFFWERYYDRSDSLYDVEEILSTTDASDGGARFIITGFSNSDRSVAVYDLVYITKKYYREMCIEYPQTNDTEELYQRWYYVETMYRMCGFSNSSHSARSFGAYMKDQ